MAELMFATGIESSYPTIEHGRFRLDELDACEHYRKHRRDFELVAELGLHWLRYGPPLHKTSLGPGRYDWSFMDEATSEMRALDIVPIIDLCHFGVPDWMESFQNPDLPRFLAEYAGAFAKRYPFVRHYTPVNEMYVAARNSALLGLWNEQLRDESAFVRATVHLARATILMMRAIREVVPDAMFIHGESSEHFEASLEDHRRFLALDLVFAHPVDDTHGMTDAEYQWFMSQNDARDSVLGVDYAITSEFWQRYRKRIMHMETSCPDSRRALAWLWQEWHNVEHLRESGVPVIGFTAYSLVDQVDWDVGLTRARGVVNPVGLFDLNRDPRPVADAYLQLLSLYGGMQA
jgi:beta-glucosidase/6-phospho-beta-glucosidase/beta-galactosidase